VIPPLRSKVDVRRGVLVSTALAMTTVLAGAGAASAAVPTVESTTERVLQSVSVSMGPDGTTTGVGSSVVRTEGSVADAESEEETFSPDDVMGDMPVRVLTSWRTSEGAGTDLSDLQGFTGRVAIDLTVQNLTVKPDVLTYDSAGASHQQAALVGSPLTVTASTGLGDLKAERVVTDDRGTGVNVTNGVLGKGADGTTVQWAALLAPPILKSSTEFSLVVDAKNFDVPSFDLSVQPGLVTDPSMAGLIDAAFNPSSSSELELQQRTIELIGEVNEVLSRASDTITDVRTSLTSTAETLGTQTVADLQASTQSVTSNMSALDAALQSLKGDLSSTLESTGSSAVAELEQAVNAVDQMLGDTSARPVSAKVRGTGCDTSVANPRQGGSIFGSLLQVAGQLDGYSAATDQCKDAVTQSILDNIGPEQPSEEACAGNASATCALFGAETTLKGITSKLRTDTLAALKQLTPGYYKVALEKLTFVNTSVDKIAELAGNIEKGRTGLISAMRDAVYGPDGRDGAKPGYLEEALTTIAQVQAPIDALQADASALKDELTAALGESRAAAAKVCELQESGALAEEDANQVLRYLQAESCSGAPLVDNDNDGATDPGVGVTPRLADQVEGAEGLSELKRVVSAADSADAALGEIAGNVQRSYDDMKDTLDGRHGSPGNIQLDTWAAQLEEQFRLLEDARGDLNEALADLDERSQSIEDIEVEVNKLIDEAEADLVGQLQRETGQVYGAGGNAGRDLEEMLVKSSNGLSSSADSVVKDGRSTINGQKSDFFQAQQQAANRVSDTIGQGLAQINNGVNASTRDMEAATTLLTADLRRVLLDLGERRNGGSGLLGAMATNAATAKTADYQLGLAGDTASSYANVRGQDIEGLQMRQAQTEASMRMLLEMPAFQLDLPSGSQHRTVYSFTVGDN